MTGSTKGNDNEAPAVTVRRAAMNLLARREHGFHELLAKLSEKYPDFSPAELLLPVLEQLRDENLQSDSRFLEAFVRYRSTRGLGPLKIASELYPRKLDSSLVEHALYDSGIDWRELCRQALQKKLGFKAGTSPLAQAEKQRLQRFLLQRGFPNDLISQVLKKGGANAPFDPD